jgi:GNAT superfamily N-acetyltransferase
VDIVAFTDEHVDGAAVVLAERHAAHLAVEPLLPRPEDFREQVEQAGENATGAAAIEGGEVVGYLLGPRREDAIGEHIWIASAGHAVRDPEVIRDLYALAAERWVADGLTRHFVYVPAMRELVEPWLRLSFGISAAQAAMETRPAATTAAGTSITVRSSTPEDTPVAAAYDRQLQLHLRESPSFGGLPVQTDQEVLDEWRNLHEEPQYTHFVAEQDGRIVGHLLLYRRPEGDLRVPPESIDLANALTEARARGSGAMVALTEHALGWAHEHGYKTMITDWRMTNLLASRFRPRRGFRETYLRLYRSIP